MFRLLESPRSIAHGSADACAAVVPSVSLRYVGIAVLAVTIAFVCPSCSDDQSSPAASVPQGPPSLSIVAPSDGACVVLRDDNGWTLRVTLAIQNWTMRPRGYCAGYPQCGFAVLFVDDVRTTDVAGLVADLALRTLLSPEGDHIVRAELHGDDDVVAVDANSVPLAPTIRVRTALPNDVQGCGLSDAASDTTAPDAVVDAVAE